MNCMVLGVGVTHPKGEDDGYEGLFYKQSEMGELARTLAGKPLYVEHLTDEPVGEVKHAWVGENGECFVLFETNEDSIPGLIAKNLMTHEVCTDLSLGHTVSLAANTHEVLKKEATEVSICEKGARPNTHIYATTASKAKKSSWEEKRKKVYNMRVLSSLHNMSTDPPQETPSTSTPAGESSEAPNVMQELMEQMKTQQAQFSELQQKLEAEQQRSAEKEKQLEVYDRVNKRKRTEVIDGTIKDFVGNLMKKYKTELTPHAEELAAMFEGMKKSKCEADPMIALLSCAASSSSANTTQLEHAYQENKTFKKERDSVQSQLTSMKTPALQQNKERFVQKDDKDDWKPVLPSGMQSVTAPRDGMQIRNPNFWKQLQRGTDVPNGMGWFQEPKLVGKEYSSDRKPKQFERA
jgi:hypothetical protein